MSWRDRLTNAEFGGFVFLTDNHEAKYGKRLVVHEYPHRDTFEVEAFGAKAQSWRLNAYFIGENYDLEANGFLHKLNTLGAAWLQHPWLGQLWVRAQDWSRSESNQQGGFCTITIDFVPGGAAPFEPVVDKVDVAYSRIIQVGVAAVDDFELQPMSNDALTELIAEVDQHLDGIRDAIAIATLPLQWANKALSTINGVKNDVETLLGIPQQYANALNSFSNVLGLGADDLDDDVPSATRVRAVARLTATATNPPAINTSTAAASISANYNINTQREAALRSQMLILAAAQIGLADYQDAASRDVVLDKLLTAIDAQLPSMSDAVFQAAVDMRTALIDALLDQDLQAATERDVLNPIPSVVLAYQMGIDEQVFIAQNGVRHPLFVKGRVYG